MSHKDEPRIWMDAGAIQAACNQVIDEWSKVEGEYQKLRSEYHSLRDEKHDLIRKIHGDRSWVRSLQADLNGFLFHPYEYIELKRLADKSDGRVFIGKNTLFTIEAASEVVKGAMSSARSAVRYEKKRVDNLKETLANMPSEPEPQPQPQEMNIKAANPETETHPLLITLSALVIVGCILAIILS